MVPAPEVQSSATSTPLPPVIAMMRSSGFSRSTSITWSAPSAFATSSRAPSLAVPVTMMRRGARLLADHRLRQALLARALDQHGRVVADAAVEQRPLDAVRHRRHEPGELGRDALRHAMHDRVPRQEDIMREAAPEMRRLLGRGVAIADRIGIVAPVGVLAMPVLAEMAPFAFAACDIMLDEDEIAFLEALALREFAARLGDRADILVPHDDAARASADAGKASRRCRRCRPPPCASRRRRPGCRASGIRAARSCPDRCARPPALVPPPRPPAIIPAPSSVLPPSC